MGIDKDDSTCISLIGMAGAGKSTVGSKIAQMLNWAFMDTDNLIEAIYGARLQDITDAFTREEFLDIEGDVISSVKASHCVIATGGSVIYRQRAIDHLARLGPIVHIYLSVDKIGERIARNPERGLVIAPGQTVEDIYNERLPLYERSASLKCDTGCRNPEQCAQFILDELGKNRG